VAGLIHLYCGDGKGKSTAAAGLAIRACGAGKRVLYVQFFKDGSSSEISVLRTLPGVEVMVCPRHFGLFRRMNEEQRTEAKEAYGKLFADACGRAENHDLIVLDEAVSACRHGMISQQDLLTFLRDRPEELEVVLTGREPSEELFSAADYVTQMTKLRHPFDKGIIARKGIEF